MAKLNEKQQIQLNILRETVKSISIAVHIIECQPGEQRVNELVDSIEEMLLDCQVSVHKIKSESKVTPIFQNILNGFA